MKRRTTIGLLSVLIGFSLAATVTGAVSWFAPTASIDTDVAPIEGVTEGAYFAYGDGTTQKKAFGISKPRHLYNLAWLTYLGYFKAGQYYFELANDIDMTGWILPPIGTTKYPFIGEFNGKDKIVSNCTISNTFSEYGTKHPGTVTSGNFATNDVKIVGFFGVIGDYPGNSNTVTYSSAVNTLSDFGLKNVTVKTYSADTLVGMVAGYSSANISDVAVDTGNINVASGAGTSVISPATNVSEHGIIGYTTNTKDIRRVDETIYSVNVRTKDENGKNLEFNAVAQGGDTGWGGSIDMKSVTKRLQKIRDGGRATSNYYYNRVYSYRNGTPVSGYTGARDSSANRIINNNDQIGHFQFVSDSSDDRYALMGGGHFRTYNYYQSSTEGHKISRGSNYLNYQAGSYGRNPTVTNGTNGNNATIWSFPIAEGSTTSTISYKTGSTTYYLSESNSSLVLTSDINSATIWTISSSGTDSITIQTNRYSLIYDGGWKLYDKNYFIIHDGTHFITSGRNASYTTSEQDATTFCYDNANSRYYTLSNTNYQLGYSSSYPVSVYSGLSYFYNLVDSYDNRISDNYGTGYLRVRFTTGNWWSQTTYTYYVKWSGAASNPWTTTENISEATLMSVDLHRLDAPSSATLTKTSSESVSSYDYLEQQTSGMNYSEDDVTYFPLSTVNNTDDFKPADNNTAYVIGGSNLTANTTTYDYNLTIVRFGYYPISGNISADYSTSSGTFNRVWTVDDNLKSVEITDESQYDRLSAAKSNLGQVLSSDTDGRVYGLHFLSSQISKNGLTNAKYVKVNKVTHTNYELPVNSIDFHLKEFGYINFLAGSYFPGNNTEDRNDSFFSLYQIERLASSPTKINRILKVKEVFQHSSRTKSYSYVYKLEDTDTGDILYTKPYKIIDVEGNKRWLYDTESTYSINQYVSELPADYISVFKTSRIEKNTETEANFINHVYYFEIPMNDGEFCLGSVKGGVGCYLMYLDIGANAAKTQRTIISEHFTLKEEKMTYPVGVAFVSYSASGIDDTDSVAMTIPKGFAGNTLTVSRTKNEITIKENNSTALTGNLVYLGDKITIESSIQEKLKPKSSTTKDVRRVQYYDYNVNLEKVTKTIITDTYLNAAETPTRTIEQYGLEADGKTWTAIAEEDRKVFQTKNGTAYDATILANPTSLPLDGTMGSGGIGWVNPGSTVLLSFYYTMAEGVSATESLTLNMAIDTTILDGQYYSFNDYAFVITCTGGTITIKVLAIGTGTITINKTTVTAEGQIIEVTAP